MKLEFALDNEKLGQVLYAIAHCNTKPEFSIEYTVSDPETAKDELLKNAISDSKHKRNYWRKHQDYHLMKSSRLTILGVKSNLSADHLQIL